MLRSEMFYKVSLRPYKRIAAKKVEPVNPAGPAAYPSDNSKLYKVTLPLVYGAVCSHIPNIVPPK